MTSTQFNELTAALASYRESIVAAKRPEYTEGNNDVLRNFKVVAEELGITPIQVWYVYFRKHIMSIAQFGKNPNLSMSEPIVGRIADAMNYLELLNALIKDEPAINDLPSDSPPWVGECRYCKQALTIGQDLVRIHSEGNFHYTCYVKHTTKA